MITPGEFSADFYSSSFLEKVKVAQEFYRKKNFQSARRAILAINSESLGAPLSSQEKALLANMLGVVSYGMEDYDASIEYFERALQDSKLDHTLTAQILLNLASSYVQTGFHERSLATLKMIHSALLQTFSSKKKEKYYFLVYQTSLALGLQQEAMEALLIHLEKHKDLDELMEDPHYDQLVSYAEGRPPRERFSFIDQIPDLSMAPTSAHLAFQLTLGLYYQGHKEESLEVMESIRDDFPEATGVIGQIDDFFVRLKKYQKVDPQKIGIILPLSGPQGPYGKRALQGVDYALKNFFDQDRPLSYVIRDSQAGPSASGYYVGELIEKEHVSLSLGGLFPEEAQKGYQEAKKRGALYVSLSPIYLPKSEKNHLLVEIPGSVESILQRLFSKEFLEILGPNAAIIYPQSQRGRAMVDAFWEMAQENQVTVTDLVSFDQKKSDLRDPVKNFLELKFKKERTEEYELLSEIHSSGKSPSARRVQTLRPVIDFDWAFIPALPKDALQLIPSFHYFDAPNLNIIGGPSWRSPSIAQKGITKNQSLFFVGDLWGPKNKEAFHSFEDRYGARPGFIEFQIYDAVWLALSVLEGEEFTGRDDLDVRLKNKSTLKGHVGLWSQNEGIWVKDLTAFRLGLEGAIPIIGP